MTRLEAANKALTLLGVATITSLDQDIQAARVMKELFPSVERAVLLEYPWTPGTRSLDPITGGNASGGWRHAFRYPSDAAAILQVYAPAPIGIRKVHYAVHGDIIYANEPGARAEFIAETDFETWPDLAAEAFTARLASDAAAALAGSPQLASALLEKYGVLVSIAKNNALNEENVPQRRASKYLDVRQ